MGTLNTSIIVNLICAVAMCILGSSLILTMEIDLEEIHFTTKMEYQNFDENSSLDNTTIVPTVPKDPVPAVVVPANCICGEHDYADNRIESLPCGERPFKESATTLPDQGSRAEPEIFATNANFTDKSQFPWVVALVERKSNGSAVHFCGGTLISNKLVLTATHCFTNIMIKNTEVWVNEKNLLLVTEGEHTTKKIKAKRLIVHPNYNPVMSYHDISMVELETPIDIVQSSLRPICLPLDTAYETQEFAYVAGWGWVEDGGPKSNILKHTCLPLLQKDTCVAHSIDIYRKRLTDYMICAGDVKNGGPDACRGDSGGPLFVEGGQNGKNRHYLVGIVSWGSGCGRPKRPGVYTRVSKYIPWIRQESKKIPDNQICSF